MSIAGIKVKTLCEDKDIFGQDLTVFITDLNDKSFKLELKIHPINKKRANTYHSTAVFMKSTPSWSIFRNLHLLGLQLVLF